MILGFKKSVVLYMISSIGLSRWLKIVMSLVIMLLLSFNVVALDNSYLYLSDMCTNGKFITNIYTKKHFYVKCGKCKACLQEKALVRTNKINAEFTPESMCAFVTLTYDVNSCPYILHSDVFKHLPELPIYRDVDVKWNFGKKSYNKSFAPVQIDTRLINPNRVVDGSYYSKTAFLPYLKHQYGKIGVCYFPDVQNFVKRLSINLKRKNENIQIRVFACTEYGPETQRPHIHMLIFFKEASFEFLRNSIIASWPYGRRIRHPKSIQLVISRPSGYVSSYVNCSSFVPSFLKTNFAQSHSHSKLFGSRRKSFALPSVLHALRRGDLSYILKSSESNLDKDSHLPIPQYVINRYFPKFKGYSRITDSQVRDLLRGEFREGSVFISGAKYYRICKQYDESHPMTQIGLSFNSAQVYDPDYVDMDYLSGSRFRSYQSFQDSFGCKVPVPPDDVHRFVVRLNHALQYYMKVTGRSSCDFADDYVDIWNRYKSNMLRSLYEDNSQSEIYKYDNLQELYLLEPSRFKEICDMYAPLARDGEILLHPNEYPKNVSDTAKMSSLFDLYTKQKHITEIAISQDIEYYS